MSGLSSSPAFRFDGPADENAATAGASTISSLLGEMVAVALPLATYAVTVARSTSLMCTVGTVCTSALREFSSSS